MVAYVHIPYSFYNITQAYNNNSCKYIFPKSSNNYTTTTFSVPDGFYTTTSLNYYLQQGMISSCYYLVNGSGQNVFHHTIQYNSYQYANQTLAYLFPTSLPAGFSYHLVIMYQLFFCGN